MNNVSKQSDNTNIYQPLQMQQQQLACMAEQVESATAS